MDASGGIPVDVLHGALMLALAGLSLLLKRELDRANEDRRETRELVKAANGKLDTHAETLTKQGEVIAGHGVDIGWLKQHAAGHSR